MFEDNRSPVQLSTQCPHCQTPLQADVGALQRSKGWARCGRCHYLFDAVAHTGIPTLAPVSSGFGDATPTATPQAPGTREAVAQAPSQEAIESTHADTASPAAAPEATAPSVSQDDSTTKPSPYDLPEVPQSWRTLSQAMDDAIPTKATTSGDAQDGHLEPTLGDQAAGQMASALHSTASHEAAAAPKGAGGFESDFDTSQAKTGDIAQSLSSMYDQAGQHPDEIGRTDQALLGVAPAPAVFSVDDSRDAIGAEDDDEGSSRAGVRWLTLVVVFVLLLLAAAQLAYIQRDWLVARMPQLQPAAQLVCQQLGCSIDPVQDMSQMRIVSSSVMRLHSGELQLDITIENKGGLQLGVPSIDVLLTDDSDQVFMTHKVLGTDWPKPVERLEANSRYPVTVRWPTNDGDASRMVGYRTQLSYD